MARLTNSTKTVDELLTKKYHLLILDLMMPQMDGFTVLKNIRKEKRLKDQPVLILSSRQMSHDETAILASQNADMIAKPPRPHRLLEKVREIVAD